MELSAPFGILFTPKHHCPKSRREKAGGGAGCYGWHLPSRVEPTQEGGSTQRVGSIQEGGVHPQGWGLQMRVWWEVLGMGCRDREHRCSS